MGQQIAIVQDETDEDAAMAFLRTRDGFVALPRSQETPRFKAVALGQCQASNQLLVPKSVLAAVMSTIHKVDKTPTTYAVDLTSGMFIEWSRTVWRKPGVAEAGRFYLARPRGRDDATLEATTTLARHLAALRRFIRSNFPACSDQTWSHVVYVGPSLWKRAQTGKAKVLYGWGEEAKLVLNPSASRNKSA